MESSPTIVMGLTAITMVMEIVAEIIQGSIALLADEWFMATHGAAFGIVVFAYQQARRYGNNPKHTVGTGKVRVMGGFESAVALVAIAAVVALASVTCLAQFQRVQ